MRFSYHLGYIVSISMLAIVPAGCLAGEFDTPDYDYDYDNSTVSTATAEPAVAPNSPAIPLANEPPGSGLEQVPTVAAARRTVRLVAGDTLYSLSVRHLGTGRRWREIAALNGLTDTQIRRLSVGRELELPVR